MSKALVKRTTSSSNLIILIGIALIAGLFYFIIKNKQSNPVGDRYSNTKTWDIEYNADGLPTKITKHVNAEIKK